MTKQHNNAVYEAYRKASSLGASHEAQGAIIRQIRHPRQSTTQKLTNGMTQLLQVEMLLAAKRVWSKLASSELLNIKPFCKLQDGVIVRHEGKEYGVIRVVGGPVNCGLGIRINGSYVLETECGQKLPANQCTIRRGTLES